MRKKPKSFLGKAWDFIWHDNSIWSWIVNVILAFVLIKFLIYPGLGFAFGTSHPVVAVVSGSMHHEGDFEQWYSERGEWYEKQGFTKEQIMEWPFHNGFNRGDIMVLKGAKSIKKGDVIVFNGNSNNPIIHRVVFIGDDYYQTKGDNNADSFSQLGETRINREHIYGEAMIRIPFLGYIKILFTEVIGGILK